MRQIGKYSTKRKKEKSLKVVALDRKRQKSTYLVRKFGALIQGDVRSYLSITLS